ncbi:hypothetical protein SAMN03159382_05761 [Pseudomonas sp. NFACC23-1]|nr:hypothetical protein SAMN03159386_05773 [Pseudomonas sp. NFACC17-2]SEJ97308.1 hypothetical protein SAMN03159382_05761 [Pseudomonas sp. NFACC23-1]SFW92983.1 hypothetical protein SAMN05660640_05894 [Pseudomonas sp. NFACC16-2]
MDVLYETAVYRIRAVTQLLEGPAFEERVYSELARILVIALPCDVLDVIGRRVRPQICA